MCTGEAFGLNSSSFDQEWTSLSGGEKQVLQVVELEIHLVTLAPVKILTAINHIMLQRLCFCQCVLLYTMQSATANAAARYYRTMHI
jgi:hypothetical protein